MNLDLYSAAKANPDPPVTVDEIVENNPAEEEEQRILDTYESDSDTPDVPIISYTKALDFLEGLRLFRLPNPHVNNRHKGEQLEALLYGEKRDIEGLQGMARGAQQQTTITGFFRPESDIS